MGDVSTLSPALSFRLIMAFKSFKITFSLVQFSSFICQEKVRHSIHCMHEK